VSGTSYAPVGQTPVIRATGQRFGCNMISAITNKGALSFMVFTGKFKAAVFVDFMRRLLKQVEGNLYLIVDGHPVHKSRLAKAFVARNQPRLRLILLPGYCPELNPDELLNQDVKTNALGKSRPRDKSELVSTVRSHLHRRQKQPQVVRNLFREKHVPYAACTLRTIYRPPQYHPWRIFSSGPAGVCLHFENRSLQEVFKKEKVKFQAVEYLTIEELKKRQPRVAQLPFIKRYPFKAEEEFRAMWESKTEQKNNLEVPIELTSITRVTLSPWLHPNLRKHAINTLKRIPDCKSIPMWRSTLTGNSDWQNFGKNAT